MYNVLLVEDDPMARQLLEIYYVGANREAAYPIHEEQNRFS